jgi:outer membrane protein assembly factor BamB
MNRRLLIIVAILIAVVIVASLAVLYETGFFSPEGSRVPWKRDIEQFATALAASDGKVFTLDTAGNVNCYDSENGELLWKDSLDGNFASGLIVSDGKIYGGSARASVSCLDEATGRFQWSFSGWLGNSMYSKRAPDGIVMKDDRVYVVIELGVGRGVSVLNAVTGELLWQGHPFGMPSSFGNISDLKTWQISGRVLGGDPFEGNFVYALGGNWSSQHLFKLNIDDGAVLWQRNINVSSGIPNVLASYQGQVIMQYNNETFSLNQTSGELLWSFNVNGLPYQSAFYSGGLQQLAGLAYHPIVYGDLLLFGASDGSFYALNMDNGTLAWKNHVDSQNLLSLVNSDNYFTAFPIQVDAQNQRVFWSFAVTEQLGTTSENKHDRYTGTICSLDLATGNTLWSRQIEDSGAFYDTSFGLVVNDDTVFLTENYALWLFGASTGNVVSTEHFDHYVLPPAALDGAAFVAADLYLRAYG